MSKTENRHELFPLAGSSPLPDCLLAGCRLYEYPRAYVQLLKFVKRQRNFAPLNGLLLHIQKPGLRYAATAGEWRSRFGRCPRAGARPLLVLWPSGPVALVYDAADTEGRALPGNLNNFYLRGPIGHQQIAIFVRRIGKKGFACKWENNGRTGPDRVSLASLPSGSGCRESYRLHVNRNCSAAACFETIVRQLARVFLGHLGPDRDLKISDRSALSPALSELEMASAAYLVCARNSIRSRSQAYLADFAGHKQKVGAADLFLIMRTAGRIEALLGLPRLTRYSSLSRKEAGDEPGGVLQPTLF